MNGSHLSVELKQAEQELKQLSKRAATFIAQFEVAQEKVEHWQQTISDIISEQNNRLQSQLVSIEQQSTALSEMMTDTGAARFRVAAEKSLQQGREHINAIDSLFQGQQKNFEIQQKKLDNTVSTHMQEMEKAENRVSRKIQNFLAQLNVEEMRELADTSRIAIEKTSADAILQSSRQLRWFNWKHFAFVITAIAFNTLVLTMYLNDEMPWETHQHASQERVAGKALMHAWPSLPEASKQKILLHTKKPS